MTVVVDTSMLIAYLHADDPDHPAARAFMRRVLRGEYGAAVTSDYVLDEGMTVLRTRLGRKEVSEKYAGYFVGRDDRPPIVEMRQAGPGHLHRALALHLDRYDRGLSFTDCVLAVLADDLEAPVASFDAGFDGIVPRVPANAA